MVSPRFHVIVFVFGVSQESQEAEGVQGSLVQPQWWKSQTKSHLARISSNIKDGAPEQKQPKGLTR